VQGQPGQRTITITGTTALDQAETMAMSPLNVTIKDPNGTVIQLSPASTWTPPGPGQRTNYSAVTVPVVIMGAYTYKIQMNYIDGQNQQRMVVVEGAFQVQ
jgi:hypothetical protein